MVSNIYNSDTYLNDLDETIERYGIGQKFKGKSILITGASGLICSAIADLLLRAAETVRSIRVYCVGRSVTALQTRFSRYIDSGNVFFLHYDTSEPIEFDCKVDYIIHGAGNAYPALMQKYPAETLFQSVFGIQQILEFAKRIKAINTIYISSSEVYGKLITNRPMSEDEYGSVDILNPRSCYPNGKRAAETMCVSYVHEYNVPVTIVRPGHVYGPTARIQDNRVSSQFAFDASEGRDLVLKSDGSQIRSYCYMLDCATAILELLLYGHSGEAYNISNKDSIISIRRLAELFAKYGDVKVRYDIPNQTEKAGFNPMKNSSLDASKLEAIGWRGCFGAERGIEHTVKIFNEMRSFRKDS